MRQRCVFTIIREEYFYLEKWYNYYSRFFEDRDIYIIHHVTSKPDTSVDFLRDKVNVIDVEEELFSSRWIRDTVQSQHHALSEKYRIVVFGDVDEIVFVNPNRYKDLGVFLDWFDEQKEVNVVKCCSFTMMHQPDKEPDFDFDKTIMSQRRYWYRYNYYDKPLISKVPLQFEFGFHNCKESAVCWPWVLMIHFHQFDFKWYMKRHTKWAKEYKASEEDLKQGWHYHYRKVDKELEHQFYHYYGTNQRITVSEIPDWVEKTLDI